MEYTRAYELALRLQRVYSKQQPAEQRFGAWFVQVFVGSHSTRSAPFRKLFIESKTELARDKLIQVLLLDQLDLSALEQKLRELEQGEVHASIVKGPSV